MAAVPFIDSIELLSDRIDDPSRYPFSIPSLRNFDRLSLDPCVTFFVGENGSGKSTLLEAIAVASKFNPEGGSRDFDFATRESHSDLCDCIRLTRGPRRIHTSDGFFYRAESFFNVATQVDDLGAGSYGDRSLHEQSHGESFLSLVVNRLRGNGLYIFDEPESALSPQRQLTFISAMYRLVNNGSQFIIATHSPIILAYPNSTILHFDESGITPVEYTETEHYKVTKVFLERREKMLAELMDDTL